MQPSIILPGLDRLISTCRTYHLRADLDHPLVASRVRDILLGQPLDPLLAKTLLRCNGAALHELGLFPLDEPDYGVGPFNERMRAGYEWPLGDALLYGAFAGFPCYLATVPPLADGNGVQPVVYIVIDGEPEVMPIASSVDRAFDLYARYLEAAIKRYGSMEARRKALAFFFPRDIPDLIAEDQPLVQMLKVNRFDAFTTMDADLPKWSKSIQRAAQDRA